MITVEISVLHVVSHNILDKQVLYQSIFLECSTKHTFPCKSHAGTSHCISELQYCDGIVDCADGSDEASDCSSGKY